MQLKHIAHPNNCFVKHFGTLLTRFDGRVAHVAFIGFWEKRYSFSHNTAKYLRNYIINYNMAAVP
jgi:hypothetical protein